MRKIFVLGAAFMVIALALTACSKTEEAPKPAEAPAPVATPAAPAPAPAGSSAVIPTTGMVMETMDADSMTYIHLDVGAGKAMWVVAPQTAVNVGEVVSVLNPVAKSNYKSAELKRDFDVVFSVSGVAPAAQNVPHPKTPIANVEVKKVSKMSGGYTVGELFAKREQLANKEVALRAQVVKFTGGIMGTNWMHLRDGTGDDKSNDLTITSGNNAKAGDVVVVKGILKKDVDIGSGYFFPLIIQDAKVTVE